jgi:hypothetical protein
MKITVSCSKTMTCSCVERPAGSGDGCYFKGRRRRVRAEGAEVYVPLEAAMVKA